MVEFKNQSHTQPPPGSAAPLPQVTYLIFVAIIYWLTVRIGLLFVARPEGIASIWPVSGLALAVLLLNPRDQWGKLLAVIFFTNTIGNWSGGNSLPASLGFALADTLEASLAARALEYLCKSKITFGRTVEIFALFGVAILCNGITALLGAAVPALAYGAPFFNTWLLWLASDGLGIVLITPVIVTWTTKRNVIRSISPRRLVEAALLAVALILFAWLLSGPFTIAEKPLLRTYMLFPLLIWLAFRFSPRGMTSALLLFATITIWNTLRGYGIFALTSEPVTRQLIAIQIYLGVVSLSGLLLSIMVTESRQVGTERQVLLDITQGLIATKDLRDFLSLVHNSIAKVIYAENFFVILYNKDTALFDEVYSVDKFDLPGPPSRLEKSISAYVFRSEQPFLSTQARFDELVAQGEVELVGTNSPSWLGVPLKTSAETIGVMVVQDYDIPDRYSERDASLLASIAGQVALVIERKQAEEQVRDTLNYVNTFIAHSPVGIITFKATGEVVSANETLLKMIGATLEAVLLQNFNQLKSWEDSGILAAAKKTLASNQEQIFETYVRSTFGKSFWCSCHLVPFQYEGEARLLAVMNDITERKQAEDALRIAEANYRSIFEHAPIGIFQSTPQGQYRSVNPAMAQIYGYDSPEEMVASVTNIAHQLYVNSSDRQEFQRLLAEHGEIPEFISRNYRRDGNIIWVQTTARVEKDMQGTILYYEGFLRDVTERKQAEENLRQMNDRFVLASYAASLGVWDWNIQKNELTWDDRMYELYGVKKADFALPYEAWLNGLHPDDVTRCNAESELARRGEKEYDTEFRVVWPDSTIHHLKAYGQVIRDTNGIPLRMIGINYDITERKRIEEALRESEEKMRSIFRVVPTGIGVVSNRILIEVNPRICEMTGYTKEELIGQSAKILYPTQEDFEFVGREKYKQIAEKGSGAVETRWQRKDGSIIDIILASTPIDPADQSKGVTFTALDITERKQAEDVLRETEERFRVIFEHANDGIHIANADGEIIQVNPRMCKLMGYRRDELLKMRVSDLQAPEVRRSGNVVEAELASHGSSLFEGLNLHSSGRRIPVEISVARIARPQGDWYISIVRDITERKQAEETLRALSARQKAILAAIPDIIMEVDNDKVYTWANRAGIEFFGEDVIGKDASFYFLGEQDTYDRVRPLFNGSEDVIYVESWQRRRDREGCLLAWWCRVLKDSKGNVVGALSTARDITEQKQAEAALRENEQRYRLIFDGVKDAIFVEAPDGRILDVNRCACEMFSYSREQFLTKTVADIVPSEDNFVKFSSNDPPNLFAHAIETVNVRASGEQFPIEISIHPQEINGEKVLFVVGRDITARKRAENEILEKSKELESLFTISSHLRTAQTAEEMLPLVLTQMTAVLNSDANAIALLGADRTHFTYAACNGMLASDTGMRFDAENSISGHVLQTRQPYVTHDYINEPNRSHAFPNDEWIGPLIVVPLQSEMEFIGTLISARTKDSPIGLFTPPEVQLLVSVGEMVGNALRRAHLYDDALSRLQRVQSLHSIDTYISANMDIKITLKFIVDQSISLMNVDAAAILLYDPNLHMLEHTAAQGFRHKDIEKKRFELEGTFSERAIMKRRIVAVSDPSAAQDRAHEEMMQKEGFAACYMTPMIAKGKVLGVLEVYNRGHLHPDQEWIDFLEALGGQAAIAIDNARLFRDLQTSNLELTFAYDATIQGWSQALELKDRETEGHTLRVAEITTGIAKLAGLSENEIMHIRRGALLHDIGKMGIPDHILNKAGKLTTKEWSIMRQHPQFAYNMLRPIEFLHPALDIPYCHHEKWDGTGYPQGLQNIQIPHAARLFAVVDVWDALTSDRVYRKAWPKKKVFTYIQKQSGKHFDPQAVDLFLSYTNAMAARKK